MAELDLDAPGSTTKPARVQGRGERLGKPAASRTASRSGKTVDKVDYTHKKQTGGSVNQLRRCRSLSSRSRVTAHQFVNQVTGGRIPREHIPSVDAGPARRPWSSAAPAGYPLVGVRSG